LALLLFLLLPVIALPLLGPQQLVLAVSLLLILPLILSLLRDLLLLISPLLLLLLALLLFPLLLLISLAGQLLLILLLLRLLLVDLLLLVVVRLGTRGGGRQAYDDGEEAIEFQDRRLCDDGVLRHPSCHVDTLLLRGDWLILRSPRSKMCLSPLSVRGFLESLSNQIATYISYRRGTGGRCARNFTCARL
jgi:hypothetical protein